MNFREFEFNIIGRLFRRQIVNTALVKGFGIGKVVKYDGYLWNVKWDDCYIKIPIPGQPWEWNVHPDYTLASLLLNKIPIPPRAIKG